MYWDTKSDESGNQNNELTTESSLRPYDDKCISFDMRKTQDMWKLNTYETLILCILISTVGVTCANEGDE
jgi:hypothetical protein